MEILRLKDVLKEKGLTSKWLCTELNLSQSYVSDIVTHKKTPSIETLIQMSEALDVDIRDLFIPTRSNSEELEDYIIDARDSLDDLIKKLQDGTRAIIRVIPRPHNY